MLKLKFNFQDVLRAPRLAFSLQRMWIQLVGLFFDFPLTESGPPFGGSHQEYMNTFEKWFDIRVLERCYNSIKPRSGNELFLIFEKKNNLDEQINHSERPSDPR